MEFGCRSLRVLNRLLRRPIGISSYRNVTGTAVKEELNTELLNTFNQDTKGGGAVPVFRRALLFPTRVALQDDLGTYTYAGLYQAAATLSNEISSQLVGDTERTIAYLCNNDASHVIAQWAIWMSGNIAVPLTPLHPPDMIKYFLDDSLACLAICTQDFEKVLRPLALESEIPLLVTGRDKEVSAKLYEPSDKPLVEEQLADVGHSNHWYGRTDALIIYTSGTTNKPKGVVWTHNMLQSQIASLHAAWQYSANDVVLHTLPLHHIHGQLNSMLASLAAGARVHMLPFAAHAVWAALAGPGAGPGAGGAGGGAGGARVALHLVPAAYWRLVREHARLFPDHRTRAYVRDTLANRLRLAAVGSAPLPQTLAEQWLEISGVPLLERYGMTECGMALSNPYRTPAARRPGSVGAPLPGVAARIAGADLRPLVTVTTDMTSTQISLEQLGLVKDDSPRSEYTWPAPVVTRHAPDGVELTGELLLSGPGVFTRYWNRTPTLDNKDFTDDGWFRTGDSASFTDGRFRILGRTSIDIIKSAGYKISALQVESAILDHPSVQDAAVIGVEHESMGEIVHAIVVLKENCTLTLRELKAEAGKKLAPYQLPRHITLVKELPRNAMGKLDKKQIKKLYGKKVLEAIA